MAEYIEREALEVSLNNRLNFLMAENGEYDHYTSGFDEAVTRVENFPAADVAPVRHGRWVQVICHEEFEDGFVDRVKECCSVCHAPNWRRTTNYCPNCGAKMDGGAGNGC